MLANLFVTIKSSLASHLEVRDIRVALHSQLERADKTAAVMEKYSKFLSNPQSAQAKALYSHISRQSGIRDRDIYKAMLSGITDTQTRLKSLIDLYDNNNHRVLISSNLTTINANALQMAAMCDFYEKMARGLVLSISELEAVKMRSLGVPKTLAKYLQNNFNERRIQFFGSILKFNKDQKRRDVVRAIRDMDDIEVDEEALEAAIAMKGKTGIAPAGFNYLNIINPKFWTYTGFKAWSELRLMYLDMEKDELLLLELRHQELAQLKERGETTVATDKLIKELKDNIDLKRYDIKELEESMG